MDHVAIQPVPRTLALDIGDRRIGVAITDELGCTAHPLVTIHRKNLPADLKSLARLARKHNIANIVIGNPLHISGELSPQAIRTQAFARALGTQLPHIPQHLVDERLTSQQAHQILDHAGHAPRNAATRRDRAKIVDQVAAVLILEAYLSAGKPQLLPPPPDTPTDLES